MKPPLTRAQQDLAGRYMPLARAIARPFKEGWPTEWSEFESAACTALVDAAAGFDPGREIRFATYATYRIRGACLDVQRALILRGGRPAADPVALVPTHEEHSVAMLRTPDEPVGQTYELREQLEHWLSKLPPRHAETCRGLYFAGETQGAVAARLGLSPSRVSYLHAEALDMLGDVAHRRWCSADELINT